MFSRNHDLKLIRKIDEIKNSSVSFVFFVRRKKKSLVYTERTHMPRVRRTFLEFLQVRNVFVGRKAFRKDDFIPWVDKIKSLNKMIKTLHTKRLLTIYSDEQKTLRNGPCAEKKKMKKLGRIVGTKTLNDLKNTRASIILIWWLKKYERLVDEINKRKKHKKLITVTRNSRVATDETISFRMPVGTSSEWGKLIRHSHAARAPRTRANGKESSKLHAIYVRVIGDYCRSQKAEELDHFTKRFVQGILPQADLTDLSIFFFKYFASTAYKQNFFSIQFSIFPACKIF